MKLVVVAMALLAATAHAGGRVIERVVAVVNNEIVLDTELDQWTAPQLRGPVDLESGEGKKAWAAAKKKALETLIDGKLIQQQAAELKLAVTPEEVDRAIEEVKRQNKLDDATFTEALKQQGFSMESYRKNLRKQILELKVLNTAVRSRVTISEDEVRAHYQQTVRSLGGERQVHLKQILVAVSADARPDEAERRRRVALKVVELARAGKSFDELAKAYSDDELTKSEGGDMGWVGKGVLVDALEEAIAGMDAGDVRGPIRTARGWHVIAVVERKQGDVRAFEEVKDQLRRQLYDQQVEKATQSWLRELRKKAHVDVRL